MSSDTFRPPIRYRDGIDYKVYGAVIQTCGEYATIRVEAQRGARKDGSWQDIPAMFVEGKLCTRMQANGESVSVGDQVAVLVPGPTPTKKLCTIIGKR